MFDPMAMITAGEVTRNHVLSARPGAPTVPERSRSGGALRRRTGGALRRLADRIEPRLTRAGGGSPERAAAHPSGRRLTRAGCG